MNTIHFSMQKEIEERSLLLHINRFTPATKLVWLDSNEIYDSGNKEIIFGERKITNGQYKYHYQIFFREYHGILSLRLKIDWLKQLATVLNTNLLTPDEEIDPCRFILLEASGKALSVEVDDALYNENDELQISGVCHISLGEFTTESILNDPEENTLLEEIKKMVPHCQLIRYEPDMLPFDFNKYKKDFTPLQAYNHFYHITLTGGAEWMSKDEKSEVLIDIMSAFYNQTKINVCLFPSNSVTIENIPGGSDSEAFCINLNEGGLEKIIYKMRKTSWY